MANCAYRILKNGTNYGIAINVTDSTSSTWGDFNYNLYVNGTANISSNLNVGGTIIGGSFTPINPLAVEYGGTGATTAAGALTNIGAASASHNHALTDLTGTLTIGKGGTNATTAANARTQLGITPANIGAKATQTAVSDPVYDGNSITFIDTISQNAQGVITPHKAVVRSASTTQNGIVTIDAQTFAGSKTFNSWIAASGNVYVRENNSSIAGGMNCLYASTTSTWDHRITFYQYSYNVDGTRTDKYDRFYFPVTASASNASSTYLIITTKNPSSLTITDLSGTLTVAKGGTGATTAANARTQLGLGTIATKATTDYKTVQSTVSGGTENGIRFLATISQNANGVISVTDTLVRDASTTQSGLVGTGAQTFAGEKSFTEHIDMKGGYYYRWYKSTGTTICAFIAAYGSTTDTVPPQIAFYEYGYNTSTGARLASYERFILPAPSSTLTTHAYYSILTTKAAVTIAQGGTGKTTATEAWTALGGGASGKHADSYFALASHNHAAGDINSGILALARGGTGQSALESSALTYTTNSHVTSAQMSANMKVFKFGKVGMLVSTGASLAAYSYSGWVKIGSVPAAYKPAMNATNRIPVSSTNWRIQIDTDGNVNVYKSTSDTTLFYCSFAYPLA